jgi:hypothetical protein
LITEEVVKFYSKELGIGYNDWRKVFCEKSNTWFNTEYHLGRLVYGKNRKPFSKLRASVSNYDYIIREFCPF